MTCEEIREALSAVLDGESSSEERERVEAHLAICAACREADAELRAAMEGIRGLPRFEPPARIRRKVMVEAASPAWEVRSQRVLRERDGARVVEWRITSWSRYGKPDIASNPEPSPGRTRIETRLETADGSSGHWTRSTS
jgi:anti-sigma factor RsiW